MNRSFDGRSTGLTMPKEIFSSQNAVMPDRGPGAVHGASVEVRRRHESPGSVSPSFRFKHPASSGWPTRSRRV